MRKEKYSLKCGFTKRSLRVSITAIMFILFLFEIMPAFDFQAPLTDVTAWIDGSIVRFRVYDPSRGQWMEGYHSGGGITPTNLTNQDGVVSFLVTSTVYFYVYDPVQGQWMEGYCNGGGNTPTNISNQDGVVSFLVTSTAHFFVYDPVQGQWMEGYCNGGGNTPTNMSNQDGVVALIINNCVAYSIYDPVRGYWMSDIECYGSGYPTSLYITFGTVSYGYENQTYYRGYDHNSGNWYDGLTRPLACFIASPLWGEGEYWVHFNDMSLGASSYYWNFGDGGGSAEQCPVHVYNEIGIFTVTQHVNGPGGSDSTSQTINTDFEAPTGTISINDGDAETTSPEVTLTLSATDNSGNVDSMRFSNNNSTWSSWEQYTTSKSWTLNSGTGTRTVYAQFQDAAGNISNSFSDSIQLVLPPTITVTSPNGGEYWAVGSTQPITWSTTGAIGNLKIEYSINNGTSWTEIIASTFNDGIYYWTIPDNPSNYCLIRVSETDGTPSDISDVVFFIVTPASITITAPNGGENWIVGSSHNITWTSSGTVGNVKIQYSINNGGSWTDITASTANDGIYNWAVPDNPSNNCLIRIIDTDSYPSDVSDAVFSIITPSITLTSPNGGENWQLGSTQMITWNATGITGNVWLSLFKDGANIGAIKGNLDASVGSYTWTVGNLADGTTVSAGSGYTVRVKKQGGGAEDFSNASFTIYDLEVTSPNGGENWELGSTQMITWNASGITELVWLSLFKDGANIGSIKGNLDASAGTYTWTVGNLADGTMVSPGSGYTIRVRVQGGGAEDFSNASFTISGLEVTSPNGGENWQLGSTQMITWDATGITELVWLSLFKDGANIGAIKGNLDASTGMYTWTVGNLADGTMVSPGSGYTVRVKKQGGGAEDFSDAPFTIYE